MAYLLCDSIDKQLEIFLILPIGILPVGIHILQQHSSNFFGLNPA